MDAIGALLPKIGYQRKEGAAEILVFKKAVNEPAVVISVSVHLVP
jgi:hypothetical protein